MLAKFYNNKSDERYVNKNIELVHDNVDIKFKEDTELVRPVLVVSSGLLTPSVNYVWIENVGRYYFIRDIKYTQGMTEISCECDVLSSFKKALFNQNVIVKRNQYLYNMYLDDAQYKVQNRKSVRTVVFPSGFTSHQIILGVVGKNSTSNNSNEEVQNNE